MESIRVGLKKYAKKNGQKMPKRCCLEASMSNQRKMKSDSLGELIFNFTRRELENPWPFFLAWKLLSSWKVSWPDKESAGVSMFSDRVDIVTGSCAAKNLTSRHFSGCSLCFAGELNERPYPSPNLHFTHLAESKLLRMISISLVLTELTFTFALIFSEMYQKN